MFFKDIDKVTNECMDFNTHGVGLRARHGMRHDGSGNLPLKPLRRAAASFAREKAHD
jgi:hypothetical protein